MDRHLNRLGKLLQKRGNFRFSATGVSQQAMTRKRGPLSPGSRSSWKLFTLLATALFMFFLARRRSSSTIPSAAVRDTAASIAHKPFEPFFGLPKIAFLFLARSNLPLDFMWQGFFQVAWGQASMIEAEQILFQAALQDTANQHFVLVSDSCVPLYNFSYIYKYVITSSKSFVDSFLDAKEGHYNPKMTSIIPKDKWRKGSQWVTLVRKHAKVVVADDLVFPVFKKNCKPKIIQHEEDCISDEHYMQTLLAMSELEDEIEHRSLTFTAWNQSASQTERQSWHPITFQYDDASLHNVKRIKDINRLYYETEHRTEWCHSNAIVVPCFLFARKFSRGAAMRLLREGVVGPFDASVLLA